MVRHIMRYIFAYHFSELPNGIITSSPTHGNKGHDSNQTTIIKEEISTWNPILVLGSTKKGISRFHKDTWKNFETQWKTHGNNLNFCSKSL